MIGKLKGVVEEVAEDHLLIDVGGVGYVVFASRRTLGQLPAAGTAVALLIDTHVREDHIHLYGFLERAERDWFRLLLTVQGVGARNSLSILSVAAPQEIAQAVLAKDRAVLTQAPGVGPKLAQRILLELKDKAGRFAISTGAPAGWLPMVPESSAVLLMTRWKLSSRLATGEAKPLRPSVRSQQNWVPIAESRC